MFPSKDESGQTLPSGTSGQTRGDRSRGAEPPSRRSLGRQHRPLPAAGATEPARHRAEELGVDLASIGGDALITVGVVEAAAAAVTTTATIELPDPLPGLAALPRIALIGAGLGATQVIDVLQAAKSGVPVAIVDDDASRWAAK